MISSFLSGHASLPSIGVRLSITGITEMLREKQMTVNSMFVCGAVVIYKNEFVGFGETNDRELHVCMWCCGYMKKNEFVGFGGFKK